MQQSSDDRCGIGSVEQVPPTREERIRSWVQGMMIFALAFGTFPSVVALVLLRLMATPFEPVGLFSVLVHTILIAMIILFPFEPMVIRRVLRSNGVETALHTVAVFYVAVRDGTQWRICLMRRPMYGVKVLPTVATLDAFHAAARQLTWAIVAAMALRGLVGLGAVIVAGAVFGVRDSLWAVVVVGCAWMIGTAACIAVLTGIEQRLTRNVERPETRLQREAITATRAALLEGIRPRELTDSHFTALLCPDASGVPVLNYTAAERLTAHVFAAQCLIDSQRFDEADAVLHRALRFDDRASRVVRPEVHATLAWLLAREGDDLNDARSNYEQGKPGAYEVYERHAFEAVVGLHSGDTAKAGEEAQASLASMGNPMYRGLARGIEAVMEDVLQQASPALP